MSDSSYGSVYVDGVTYIDEREIAKRDAEIERLLEGERVADAEIERLRVYVSGARCPHCDELRLELGEARGEIERLRGRIAEIEKWKDEGERIMGPAAEWGPARMLRLPSGNVMVQSSTMFKLGAWWADRPWRVREALGDS